MSELGYCDRVLDILHEHDPECCLNWHPKEQPNAVQQQGYPEPAYIPMRTRPEYVKEIFEGQGRIMAALDEQAKTIADWLLKLDGRIGASLKGVADLRGDLGVKIEALRYEVFCKNNPVPAKPKKPRKKR